MRRYFLLCVSALIIFAAKPAHAKDTYKFEFPKNKNTDSAQVQQENGKTIFVITSPSGISEVKVTLTQGQWPRQLVLRYLYKKDTGFRYLESWGIRTETIAVHGSQRQSGAMPFYFQTLEDKSNPSDPPAGTLDIRVQETDKAMEVTLPPNMLQNSKQIQLSWIDAYRN